MSISTNQFWRRTPRCQTLMNCRAFFSLLYYWSLGAVDIACKNERNEKIGIFVSLFKKSLFYLFYLWCSCLDWRDSILDNRWIPSRIDCHIYRCFPLLDTCFHIYSKHKVHILLPQPRPELHKPQKPSKLWKTSFWCFLSQELNVQNFRFWVLKK